MAKLTIPGTLPAMNEMISAAKGHWGDFAEMKRTNTEYVRLHAIHLPKYERIDIEFTWYCPNKRKDMDNVMGGGQKFIFDGLQAAGVIKNDGWNQIRNMTHRFEVDKKNPRIEIEIREVV